MQVTDNGDGTYTLDLSRMNPKSLRTAYDNGQPLPNGNEKSANNRPYNKFTVSKDVYGSRTPYDFILEPIDGGKTSERQESTYYLAGYRWVNHNFWEGYQNVNPCPEGYRIPNQRELLLMATRLSKEQWPVYSTTATYYTGHWGDWYWEGWLYTRDWINEGPFDREFNNLRPVSYDGNGYYMCQTSFSMDGKNGFTSERDGFMWIYESGVFMLQNNRNEVGYVRCVKDTN